MNRIAIIAALLITALSCSGHKVDKVTITGRLLKSNGSPVVGVPVYLYPVAWSGPSESERFHPQNKSDATGRFTFEFVNCQGEIIDRGAKHAISWGYGLHRVSNKEEPVILIIDCKSKGIELGDLISINSSAAEVDKFIITGILHKPDGSPIAGAKLTLNEVTRQGTKMSYSSTYDRTGFLLNPQGESEGNGEFAIYAGRSFVKKGQDYAVQLEQTLSEVFGQKEILTAVLSNGKSPFVFKIEGDPREINLGEITVETK